jgi:hypothetical protein
MSGLVSGLVGTQTKAGQPAFLTYVGSTISNQTGDATSYTIVWDTELFDQNADVSGATFTAPVTGKYLLTASIALGGVASGDHDDLKFAFVTSDNEIVSYMKPNSNIPGTTSYVCYTVSHLIDMDAADTAYVAIVVRGGAKTVDVVGSSDVQNAFSGVLIV